MKHQILHAFFIITTGFTLVQASKILVLPFGIYSHINLFSTLGRALKDDGHDVWVLADDQYKDKIEKMGLTPLTFPLNRESDMLKQAEEWMEEDPGKDMYEQFVNDKHWLMSNSRICDSVMQNIHLMTTIEKQRFDLVVFDGADIQLCILMIPYKFDIPFLTVHGFQTTTWASGVTGMPSIEPEIDTVYSNKMNFWERIENLKSWLSRYNNMFSDLYSEHHMNSYCPAHKPRIPLKQLAEKSEIYLMNFEIICLDYPRVSAPNTQYLGASSATPAKRLPEDLEAFIKGADHGVVLMSLGSMKAAQHVVWKIIGEKIFKAFGRLRQKVIVQYRLDEVHGEVPENVKLMKWLPQNDILGHPKTKLFVMHGGNNGQNEAVYHGVPMLVIPVSFDQVYSAKRVEAHSYGNYVKDKQSVTSDDLYQMMNEILTNETYSTNIKKCSAIIHSLPSAQEKFVFWVNHILKFGGAHLRPPSLDMPLYQVLMLDIVAYYMIMALAAIHAGVFLLYSVGKYFLRYCKPKRE